MTGRVPATGRGPTADTGSATSPGSAERYARSRRLDERLTHLVPGGAHTYAKASDQYPAGMAPIIARGRGAHVWDVDGNRYVEYGSGLRAVALGHAHPRVNAAVRDALEHGTNFARPSRLELQAAEALLDVVPRADMVKFAKNGSDATTAAIRLARAATGRELVAVCADHPFFSVDDWFIATTPMAAGIPESTREATLRFRYDDVDDVRALLESRPVAAIVLEPATTALPSPGYFEALRALCDRHGTLLVLDEMITGFRWATGGAQNQLGISPDLTTFGKAMGNGFAISALAGRREYMRLGGMGHDQERVFLLSTTHGAESTGLAAAMAVIDVHHDEDVPARLRELGEVLRAGVTEAVTSAGVGDHIRVLGVPCNLVHATLDAAGRRSQAFRTLFLAELLDRGVIAPSFVVSAALTAEDIAHTAEAVYEAGLVYRKALENGIESVLRGRPVKPAIRRFG